MAIWKPPLAAAMALLASPAFAGPNWVVIGTLSGHPISIAMGDFSQGTDGIVYFQDSEDGGDSYFDNAVDCPRRVMYLLGGSDSNIPDWRDQGRPVKAGSLAEAELNIVCPKAGSGPLPGTWVAIGSGQSIDKDTIRRESDGLVHFTSYGDTFHSTESDAVDCQQRLIYFSYEAGSGDQGLPVGPNTFAEAELNYACANGG